MIKINNFKQSCKSTRYLKLRVDCFSIQDNYIEKNIICDIFINTQLQIFQHLCVQKLSIASVLSHYKLLLLLSYISQVYKANYNTKMRRCFFTLVLCRFSRLFSSLNGMFVLNQFTCMNLESLCIFFTFLNKLPCPSVCNQPM